VFPYLDLAGFRRRTVMSVNEVDYVEADSPGFAAARIAIRSSYINGRLRKRYGVGGTRRSPAASLPLGQMPPLLVATIGPVASLQGRPQLGSLQLVLAVTLGGAIGTATFSWSIDGGATFPGAQTGVVTSTAGNPLAGTGLTVVWPTGVLLTAGDVQSAATPVPEVVLGWLATMVTHDVMRKRGINPSDPMIQQLREDLERVELELKEAADSKDGLWDLPASEDLDSAVTTGGPLGRSDGSPYAWQARQARRGMDQDADDLTEGVTGILGPYGPEDFQ
jgi:hypothetical protein